MTTALSLEVLHSLLFQDQFPLGLESWGLDPIPLPSCNESLLTWKSTFPPSGLSILLPGSSRGPAPPLKALAWPCLESHCSSKGGLLASARELSFQGSRAEGEHSHPCETQAGSGASYCFWMSFPGGQELFFVKKEELY